jgi:hypothetical protein
MILKMDMGVDYSWISERIERKCYLSSTNLGLPFNIEIIFLLCIEIN